MTQIPEQVRYELVTQKDDDDVFELPEGAVIVDYGIGLGKDAKLVYLKPVDSKSKTRTEGDRSSDS